MSHSAAKGDFSAVPTQEPSANNDTSPPLTCVVAIQHDDQLLSSEAQENNQRRSNDEVITVARPSSLARETSSSEDSDPCVRLIAMMSSIMLVFCFLGIFYSLHPPPVIVHPKAFTISNYTANWEADFFFGCHPFYYCDEDSKTRTHYDSIMARVSYNEIEDVFSEVRIEPFVLGATEHKKGHVKYGNTSTNNEAIVRMDHLVRKWTNGKSST